MKPKEEKKQDNLLADYSMLLGLIDKYDMDNLDTRLIVGIVADYFDKNLRW